MGQKKASKNARIDSEPDKTQIITRSMGAGSTTRMPRSADKSSRSRSHRANRSEHPSSQRYAQHSPQHNNTSNSKYTSPSSRPALNNATHQNRAVAPRRLGNYPEVEGVKSRRKDRTGQQPKKKHNHVLPVLGGIVLIVAIAYAAGTIFFSTHFYPNTSIVGVDVGFATAEEANNRMLDATKSYSLHVVGDGIDWTFAPEDPARVFNADNAVQATLGANTAWEWPVRLFQAIVQPQKSTFNATDANAEPDRTVLASSFDSSEFTDQLGAAIDTFNANRTGTFTTASAYDETTGKLTVEKALEQQQLNKERITQYALVVLTHLGTEANIEDLGTDAFVPLEGSWTEETIQAACDAANNLLGVDCDVTMQGNVIGHIDASVVLPWIVFDAKGTPSLDQTQLATWAANTAASLNTVGTTRTYTRADGKQISVSGGAYGWAVDEAAVTQALTDAVNTKRTEALEIPCSQTAGAYTGQGKADWKKYVDVDLTEQHARLYDENGNLVWESNVITGNPTDGDGTPTGVWAVTNKSRNTTLISPVKDPETGEPSYESPVDYWIAFEGNLVGFHDASWQNPSSYDDPQAYLYVGSHGCVNTPYDAVAQLYDLLDVGDCVVVHE